MPHASVPSSKFQPASSAPAAHSGAFSSLLRCEGVYKSYHLSGRDVPALRGIDLSIDQPGFYAIMGQSGKPLHELDEQQATLFRRRGIGIVFQQFTLIA